MIRIAVVGANWHTNQGNAFHNIGMMVMLERIGGYQPSLIEDPPSFFDVNLPDAPTQFANLEVEHVIFSGPCIGTPYLKSIAPIAVALGARGIRCSLISAGLTSYDMNETEKSMVAEMLIEIDPKLVVTRDRITFRLLSELVPSMELHDGICSSAFLHEIVNYLPTYDFENLRVIVNAPYTQTKALKGARIQEVINLLGSIDGIDLTRQIDVLSTTTNPHTFRAPFAFGDRLIDRFFGSRIRQVRRKFDLYSDNWFVMLAYYRSADLVISDRVHVCAAALAVGTPAHYLLSSQRSRDGRSSLLDKMGFARIFSTTQVPPDDFLQGERSRMRRLIETNLL